MRSETPSLRAIASSVSPPPSIRTSSRWRPVGCQSPSGLSVADSVSTVALAQQCSKIPRNTPTSVSPRSTTAAISPSDVWDAGTIASERSTTISRSGRVCAVRTWAPAPFSRRR